MANVWICFAYCVCIHVVSANMTNIAIGKPASGTRDARRAVDGNLTTFTVVQKGKLWWGYMRTVKDAVVKVFFGPEDKRITTDVELHTGNNVFIRPDGKLCHIVKGGTDGTDIPDITANCTGSWEFIAVYAINELNLAEVVVSVCTDGTYGDNCSKSCSSRYCAGSSTFCARYTGACQGGCQTGWAGIDCTDCANGIYGASCNKTCSVRHCAVASESCDRQNWACLPGGCTAGWTGTDCTEACRIETYGKDCMENCGHCNGTCEAVDGRCLWGCLEEYHGIRCQEELPTVMTAVIAGVVGAVSMLVVIGGVLTCLLRLGRLQWLKASRSDEAKQSTEMSDVSLPSVVHQGMSDITQSMSGQSMSGHVYNNDYEVLNSKTKSDKDVYEVITDEKYQN